MFAVSPIAQSISPHCMRFEEKWIYDLRPFHSFWQQTVIGKMEVATGKSAWNALLQSYQIHSFSATEELLPFAQSFHKHQKNDLGSKNFQKIFSILKHLGLKKVGHLRRLPIGGIQKRFGKAWANFFYGVLEPDLAPWVWKPFRFRPPLELSLEFDPPTADGLLLLGDLKNKLEEIAEKHPQFSISSLEIHFKLFDHAEEKNSLTIPFVHSPFLKRDIGWIYKLLEERLLQFQLPERVEKIDLSLQPAKAPSSIQLALFQQETLNESWRHMIQKLEDQDFKVFVPANTSSYVPEKSWISVSPLLKQNIAVFQPQHGLFRPLIQESPLSIHPPEGRLDFLERISWFDEKGDRHLRDYFRARSSSGFWIWIFKNEKNEWYRQGIMD